MTQTLHIFRKDVRHHWVELLLYVLLLTGFAVVTEQSWHAELASGQLVGVFQGLLKMVIPIVWLVMLARLVHEESLVGDQQFWVTRPYRWGSLLGAKALFVVVCVALPFAAMQCVLLLVAGLNPLTALPGLLENCFYLGLIFWLPFLAVAAVTSTVPRAFMSVIGAFILCGVLLTIFGKHAGARMWPPYLSGALGVLFGVSVLCVLLYQYATRDSLKARSGLVLAVFAPFLLFCGVLLTPLVVPVNALVQLRYPAATGGGPRLVFDADPRNFQELKAATAKKSDSATLILPVRLEGMDANTRVSQTDVAYTLDMGSYHYAAPWSMTFAEERGLLLAMPADVYERVAGKPVSLHLRVAMQPLRPDAAQAVTVADRFHVPQHGVCTEDQEGPGVRCQYAFGSSVPTEVQADVTAGACGSGGPVLHQTVFASTFRMGLYFDPVSTQRVQFRGRLCPGAAMTFVPYREARGFRVEMEIPAVDVAKYAVSMNSGGGSSGVSVRTERR